MHHQAFEEANFLVVMMTIQCMGLCWLKLAMVLTRHLS